MKTSALAGSLLASLALIATPLQSQSVSTEVVIRSGSAVSHRQARRVVVIEREAPRIIVVERVQRAHQGKHWRRHGYRRVVVYYVGGRYYTQYPNRRSRVQEVVVYQRRGRYYRDDDHRRYRENHRGWSHDRHDDDWHD